MRVEGWLFLGCAIFFGVADVFYWTLSHDPTGSTALALSVALAFLIGFYLLFTGRRLPKRPEDDAAGRDRAGHRRTRVLQPAQLVAAVRRPGRRAGGDRSGHRLVAVPDGRARPAAQRDRLRLRVLPRPLRALDGTICSAEAAVLRACQRQARKGGCGRLRGALHDAGDAPGQA